MNLEEIRLNNRIWYMKIYDQIILKALKRGLKKSVLGYYTEKHHILPKCQGGDNRRSNLCLVTYREHVILHKLLSRMFPENCDLAHSAYLMLRVKTNKDHSSKYSFARNSREAEEYRLKYIALIENLLEEEKRKRFNYNIGKWAKEHVYTEEDRKIKSEAMKGIRKTDSWKKNLSDSLKGRTFSEQTREKMRLAKLGSTRSEDAKRKTSETLLKNRLNNKSLKQVIDPKGKEFPSVKDCAAEWKVDPHTMSKWINHFPEKGFKFK